MAHVIFTCILSLEWAHGHAEPPGKLGNADLGRMAMSQSQQWNKGRMDLGGQPAKEQLDLDEGHRAGSQKILVQVLDPPKPFHLASCELLGMNLSTLSFAFSICSPVYLTELS